MEPERRFFEFRQTGRTLTGIALPYRTTIILPWGRERFLPGAFGDVQGLDVLLTAHHLRSRPIARTGGGGLLLEDSETELRIKADIPESRDGDDVLLLIKNRILRGLSIEFVPTTEGLVDGVREITLATLHNISVVDRPAYPESVVAARNKPTTPEPPRRRITYYV